jgi:benzodiazapine receptor
MVLRLILFLIINFAALGLGGLFTGSGVSSTWYAELNKAPWTPPGWVFGAAWTLIMVCFSVYMAYLWPKAENKTFLLKLFALQWILNVLWNPVFFYYQNVTLGLLVILSLTFLVGYFLFRYAPSLGFKSVLILPYFLWLIIASSLNLYILIKN